LSDFSVKFINNSTFAELFEKSEKYSIFLDFSNKFSCVRHNLYIRGDKIVKTTNILTNQDKTLSDYMQGATRVKIIDGYRGNTEAEKEYISDSLGAKERELWIEIGCPDTIYDYTPSSTFKRNR